MHDWEIESMAHLLEDIYYDFCNFFLKKDFQLKRRNNFSLQSTGKFVYHKLKGSFLLVLYGSREDFDNK